MNHALNVKVIRKSLINIKHIHFRYLHVLPIPVLLWPLGTIEYYDVNRRNNYSKRFSKCTQASHLALVSHSGKGMVNGEYHKLVYRIANYEHVMSISVIKICRISFL